MTGEVKGLDELEAERKKRRLENRTSPAVSLSVVFVSLLVGPRI